MPTRPMKKKNLIGQTFGILTIIREIDRVTMIKSRNYYTRYQTWEAICKCGNIIEIGTNRLTSYGTKSCGCIRRKDYANKRFGMLTAIKFTKGCTHEQSHGVTWLFRCDCGNEFECEMGKVTSGDKTSCGCRKQCYHTGISTKDDNTRWIKRWFNRSRTTAKNRGLEWNINLDQCLTMLDNQRYKCNVSGIDISLYDRSASLDRIDSSKGYTIDNIQWVHRSVNFMKQALSQSDFIKHCMTITDYQRGKDQQTRGSERASIP